MPKPINFSEKFEIIKLNINNFNKTIPPYIQPEQVPTKWKLPFKVLALRETSFLRFLSIVNEIPRLYEENKPIPALILLRSALEMTVLIYKLHIEIDKAISTENVDRLNEFVKKCLIGSRSRLTDVHPHNINASINEMNKKFKGIKGWYEMLCGYTHPNYEGMMLSFSKWNEEKFIMELGPRNLEHHKSKVIFPLESILMIFNHYYNGVGDEIQELVKLFNKRK